MSMNIGNAPVRVGPLVVGNAPGLALGGGRGGAAPCAPVDQIDGNVADESTFVHPADGVVAADIDTVPSAGNVQLQVRIQDAANLWEIRVNSAGDINLLERVAAANTNRGTAAGIVANGHRLAIVLDGSTIQIYSNGILRITYASASNFAILTDGKIQDVGTNGTLSDLKAWSLACREEEGV